MCIGLTTIQLCPPIQRQIWGSIQTLTHQLLCIPATLLIQIIRYTTQIKCTFFICWRARICQQCWTTLQRCGPIYPGAFLESHFFCFFEAFDRFWCCTEHVSPTFAVSKTVRCRYNPDKNKSKGCVCMIVITVSDSTSVLYIDGLVQEWRNSIANALFMSWWCKKPRNQQPWYWPISAGIFWFSEGFVFTFTLCMQVTTPMDTCRKDIYNIYSTARPWRPLVWYILAIQTAYKKTKHDSNIFLTKVQKWQIATVGVALCP